MTPTPRKYPQASVEAFSEDAHLSRGAFDPTPAQFEIIPPGSKSEQEIIDWAEGSISTDRPITLTIVLPPKGEKPALKLSDRIDNYLAAHPALVLPQNSLSTAIERKLDQRREDLQVFSGEEISLWQELAGKFPKAIAITAWEIHAGKKHDREFLI